MSSTNSNEQGFTSAEEYQMLLESFAQAFWETDAQGLVVTDSPSWRAYTGQSVEAWLDQGWTAVVHPDDQVYALSQWQEAARQLQPVNAEFRLQRPGGGWRWTNVRAVPILNADGSVRKWLGINIDIQDKKEIEAALQQTQQAYQRELEEQVAEQTRELEESRALLQSTLDSTLDMIQVFKAVRNQKGEIVDFVWTLNNQSSKRQYGDVIGKSLLTLNPGVKEVGIFDTFKQVCETGIADQSERHYVHEQFDGWFDQSTVKLGDGVATTTTDITRRKKAEQELKDQAYFITSVTEMMPDVVSVVELPARKIIYANRDTMSWLDFNPDEITSLSFQDRTKLFHPDDLPAIQDFYERFSSLQDRQENKVEYRLKNKKGEWVLLSLRGQVFNRDGQGNATQLLLVGQNITTQRRAEEEILRLKDEVAQKATNKYEALFNAIDEGFSLLELIFDEQGKVVDYWHRKDNPAFTRMTGIQDPVNRRMSELVPNLEPEWHQMLEEVYYTGQSIRTEYPVHQLGQWYSCYLSRVGSKGSPFIACVYDDITERKRMQERQAYLLSLSDALRPLSDPLAIQQESLRLLCTQLKIPRAIYAETRDQEGTMLITAEQVEAGFLPMKGEIVHFSDLAPEAPTEALLGRPLWREDVFSEEHSPARQAGYAAFQTRSWVMIPLVKQGRLVAELTVHHSEPHAWTAEEISLIEQTTDRTWAAVERAKAEEALQESEKRLRLTIEATQLATWEWNLETNEVYWNEQHFRLFGMEPKANPQNPEEFMRHVHPREQERVKSLLEEAIAERKVYDAEFCAIREDGSSRWMSGYGRITEERDGQPLRMSGVMFDIDERRRAQESLHQSESRLRAIFKSAKDYAIYTTDLTRHITSWNRGAEVVFGYSESEMMQQLGDQLYSPDDRAQGIPENEAKKAIREGEAENERWHIRKDGSYFYGSGVVTPLRNEDGMIVGLLKVMRDLTVQKRAEEGLKEADRRKNEFLAMLAHELRNPMATL
ncbi:hypothetical protein BWI93_09780, partial [Siphonobacter sp. BAB-5385]|uniref:PAS domain S-box protein n=1 Tax=Siphonobacter sp. BAB-5385 TaxID=1864822 RepID=UPI000BCCD8FC